MSEKYIPFGKIVSEKIILNPWGGHPEREIGEVKDGNEEASIEYFQQKYDELAVRIRELEELIETSQNKGSFLMKLLHLKDTMPAHVGLGDYQSLHDRLEQQEAMLREIIAKNRERNAEIKRALIEEAEAAVANINWKEATEQVNDIKTRWIKTGNAKEGEQELLDQTFWGILEGFYNKKKQFYEDKKLLFEKRKREYEQLVEESKELVFLYGKAKFDKLNDLKQRWKDLGNIPREDFEPLMKAFMFNLKNTRRPPVASRPGGDVTGILETIDAAFDGQIDFDFKEFDEYKKALKAFRTFDSKKKTQIYEALQKIQLLTEQDFVDKLAMKRFRDFRSMDREEKAKVRVTVLEELLARDKADLEKYQDNAGNFSGGGQRGMMSMVEQKLQQQQRKIRTKEILIALLKAGK